MFRTISAAILVLLLVAGAACNNDETGPTPLPSSFTQLFSGTVDAGAAQIHTFTVVGTAPVRIMLASLTVADQPVFTPVTLVFGIADGLVCRPLTTASVAPSLVSPIRVTAAPGDYCVEMKDTSALSGTAAYAIRILYGLFAQEEDPGTITYASQLFPGGSTARSFTAQNDGGVMIFMDSITPSSVQLLGVNLGIPRADAAGCHITTSNVVARNHMIQASVDAGPLCVRVFDPGTLTELTGFSIRIEHP